MLREEFIYGQFALIETCREFIDISLVELFHYVFIIKVYFDMQNLHKRAINEEYVTYH